MVDLLDELKALSCVVPRNLKEAKKMDTTVCKVLHRHPSLRKAFNRYLSKLADNEGNFLFCPCCGTVIPKENQR